MIVRRPEHSTDILILLLHIITAALSLKSPGTTTAAHRLAGTNSTSAKAQLLTIPHYPHRDLLLVTTAPLIPPLYVTLPSEHVTLGSQPKCGMTALPANTVL